MKFKNRIKATLVAAGAFAFSSMAIAQTNSAFGNVQANNQSLGKMSKNAANSLVDATALIEAGLYLAGIIFITMFIFALVKWKKSEGRDGSPGLIAVYLIASVFCIAAPTVIGGGMGSIFGTGTVQTVKPPSPTFGN
ncbi:hypothetical protein [Paucibacter soli]|uniref:hypothetical protein n=1 Tax=Paucibacter soli TaxID=3133433 RepID=UPI0030B7DBFA